MTPTLTVVELIWPMLQNVSKTLIHTHIHTYIHVHTHLHIHMTYIHTYIHTYIFKYQEFESYYFVKFKKQPKLIKKIGGSGKMI